MTFTDDDLTRLKNESEIELIHALLFRLETAERCAESCDDLLHHGIRWPNGAIHKSNPDVAREALEAWRKAAGK